MDGGYGVGYTLPPGPKHMALGAGALHAFCACN